jgi:MFS family permease
MQMKSIAMQRLEVFQYRPYLLYFIAYLVSSMGNGMQFIANSWLALELTGKGSSVAFVLIASALPGIVLSPVIGIYVDRIDRKRLAACMDLCRALVILTLPLLWWLGLLQPWHLYLSSFLVAMGKEVYMPSAMGLIREVVPQELLLYANSSNVISLQIGTVIGAAIGGLIIAISTPVMVMIINAITFFFSAFCILNMRKGQVRPKEALGKRLFMDEMREGLTYIAQHTDIIVKYLILLFIWSSLYTINVLLAPFARDVLRVGAAGFGYIDASFALGAILGSLLLPIILRRYGAGWTMTAGMWAISICLLAFGVAPNLWLAIASYLLLGMAFQVAILYITKVQERVPVSHQGRVHSVFNTLFSIASLGVFLIMGYLGQIISIRWLYGFQSAVVALVGLAAYRWIYYEEKKGQNNVTAQTNPDNRRQKEGTQDGESVGIAGALHSEEG